MSDIAANISRIKDELPQSVKLIAVSKTKPAEDILEAYNSGQKLFGENRVQELLGKKDLLPEDIEWHLIGHLQSNKVKYIVPFISMIQSVDSYRLLTVINNEASKIRRIVNCLLQIHIASEETKFGFSMDELKEMFDNEDFSKMESIRICGVMGMATFTDDYNLVKHEFDYLKSCFDSLRLKYFSTGRHFTEISMGMSGDYKIALEAGSTMVRIGSLLFGSRNR